MNLWIRSQDKEDLINNPLRIYYDSNYEGVHKVIANTYDETIYLGIYKTKERALEVLDEIQNILIPIITYKQNKPIETIQDGIYRIKQDIDTKIQELSTYVYVMPKE